MQYAYTRGIPVQFVMSFGNEKALNEKKLRISYGEEITYKIGKVMHPRDYPEAKEFIDAVLDEFVRFFDETLKDTQNKVKTEDTTNELMEKLEFKTE